MTAESPMLVIAALIAEAGGGGLHACMQCGTCTGVCPWPTVEQLSPRLILRQASLGLEGWEEEQVWRCVTCRACEDRCPRGIEITEVMRAARSVVQESGGAPRGLSGPLASLRTNGNPWEGESTEHGTWMKSLEVPSWDAGCEALLVPCCTQVHESRNRRASRALVGLLHRAGVRFGTMPEGLQCCGDQARKVGAEDAYQHLNEANLRVYRDNAIERAWVASPHCLNVMRAQPGTPTSEHYTEVLWRLVEQGRLLPTRSYDEVVTYHDPCYLGRWAGVYDAPRHTLEAIPGLELREMPRNREESFCCGGGGGGLWQELPIEQRFAVHRVREALETGARVLVTACPYCVLMFEDAIKVLELEGQLEVRDVAEVLARAVGVEPSEATP